VDETEHDPSLWTNHHDSMYLPASTSAVMASLSISDSLGCHDPISTLSVIYSGPRATTQLRDYSGIYSLPLKRE